MKTLIYTTNLLESREKIINNLDFLDDYKKEEQIDYLVTIKLNRPIRDTTQNGKYWIMLKAISLQSGYTDDELHECYKQKFNGKEIAGQIIGQSTTGLDEIDFEIYYKKVKQHGESFFNAYIGKPEA